MRFLNWCLVAREQRLWKVLMSLPPICRDPGWHLLVVRRNLNVTCVTVLVTEKWQVFLS